MAISTQIQNLNLIPGKSAPVVVHLSQGNVGNTVQFYLYDGDNPYYPTNVSIAVHGVRADGSVFGPYTVSVTSGTHLVSFSIVSAMTSVAGAAIGELVITDSGQNQVGSANFGMLVEETPYSSSVTYEDDLSIYQRILAYVQSFPASVSDQINAVSTQVTTVSSQVTTETGRAVDAENLLSARIDQIVSPSGEAPSSAEVADARISSNGATYSTLGNAIRTPFSDFTDALTGNIVYCINKNTASGYSSLAPVAENIDVSRKIYIRVRNIDTSAGYFVIRIYHNGESTNDITGTQLLNANGIYSTTLGAKLDNSGKWDVYLQNINSKNTSVSVFYSVYEAMSNSEISTDSENIVLDETIISDSEGQLHTFTGCNLDMSYSHVFTFTNVDTKAGYIELGPIVDGAFVPGYTNGNKLVNSGESFTYNIDGAFGANEQFYTSTVGAGVYNINGIKYRIKVAEKQDPYISYIREKERIVLCDPSSTGNGIFADIQNAVDYCKKKWDVNTTSVTIKLLPGVYHVRPVATRPSAINKWANKISIIGDSPYNTILKLENSGVSNKVIEHGGDSSIENITVLNLKSGDITDWNYNPYCIHNDEAFNVSYKYTTLVKNCVLYSEMAPPVGAGLKNNQKQRYENVTCVYSGTGERGQGALYVHSQSVSTDVPYGLEIIDCRLITKNGLRCLTTPNVIDGQYLNIPVTIRGSYGWTNGSIAYNGAESWVKLTPDTNFAGSFLTNTEFDYPIVGLDK